MKIAPIMGEMAKRPDRFQQVLVHTGQHYDDEMSQVFFADLGIPRPDVYLGVGPGSHAEQTAGVMLTFEPMLKKAEVQGGGGAELACALVCAKIGVRVAHVEAGLQGSGEGAIHNSLFAIRHYR